MPIRPWLVLLAIAAAALLPDTLLAQTSPLAFQPIDAQYSSSLDKIIMVSANPNELHIYDPVANRDTIVDLQTYVPLNVSVSPDGDYAAVMHNSAVSYINLQTATVERVFPTSAATGEVVLSDNYIYILPSPSSYASPISINVQTAQPTTSSVVFATGGRLDTAVNAIYGTDDGTYPEDLFRYDLSSGPMQTQKDSPYHGDYPICGDVWFPLTGAGYTRPAEPFFMLPRTPAWTCFT